MCWEVVSPLLMALGNGPYSVIYSHPCMPSSPCSAFWSNYYEKQYPKSHVLLLSNILKRSSRVFSLYAPDNNNQTQIASDIYIGGHFLICLLQSITLIWPCLGLGKCLKFLHKSMDFSFLQRKITQNVVCLEKFGCTGLVWSSRLNWFPVLYTMYQEKSRVGANVGRLWQNSSKFGDSWAHNRDTIQIRQFIFALGLLTANHCQLTFCPLLYWHGYRLLTRPQR